jgi:hypothetical protein
MCREGIDVWAFHGEKVTRASRVKDNGRRWGYRDGVNNKWWSRWWGGGGKVGK